MLSVHDHPIVQQIDSQISQSEAYLSSLQVKRIVLTKSLLKSTYEVAQIICHNLYINQNQRDIALLCGYEYLTNIQMVEQWLLEQLVELNQSRFECAVNELENRFLMRLNSLKQDKFIF